MAVIAMTREMGSLGRDVALGLSEELGLDLVQHEVVERLVDKMHVRESSVNRFIEGKANLFQRWGIDENDFSLYTTEEILEVAERGNVLIRGWGATYILREVTHVPCIRVCAAVDFRARVLMQRIGIDDERVAAREIRRNDAAHARTMSQLFHVDYEDPILYDLVLNTDKLSQQLCVDIIKDVVASEEFKETDASRRKLAHLKTSAQIHSALRSNPVTRQSTPSFGADFDPDTRTVVLTGVAMDDRYRKEAENVVGGVPGVESVRNEMVIVRPFHGGP